METEVSQARGVPSAKPRRYRADVRFRVLGPLEASADDGPIALGGPKQRVVLAHLLLRANQVVPSDHLIDAVWGEEPPEAARGTLQAYVSRLRSVLGAERIEGRAPGYLFRIEPEELDATRFEVLLREARGASSEPKVVLDMLGEALDLWRGPALADLAAEASLQGEIARLEELHLSATEEQFSARLDLGEHAEVVAELEAATIAHPLRERLWSQLVLALYRSGRQAEALAAFDRARLLLANELGIDPSRELQDLHQQVLRQDESLQLRGESLRGYRLLEKVGEGAFGVVYRAIQPQVEREVAIKSIHSELANQPDFVRRFEREAQLVARLEHPHIVPLYDYWREPDAAYLIMRFLRGGSLEDLIREGPLELERAAQVLNHMAAALAAAHHQGVVHRDVKPGNVLLDEDGNAYLSDFGIALETGAPEQTAGTMIRGTPAYLSPEQIRLEQTTPRSDIYALGIVLYEMLTAEHPFPGTSLNVLLDQHLHQPIPSVRDKRPEIPPAVDATIGRATAKDPEARFPDVLELAAAFRSAVEGTGRGSVTAAEMRNPYKGLRAFLEADSADFFGREILTRRLVERIAETGAPRFLCAVGPSGSGKSSVVRAGLVPAIRRGVIPGSDRWYVIEVLPGAHPMRELETALLGVSVEPPPSLLEDLERDELGLARAVAKLLPDPEAELLIVLDQLEEIFTMVEDEAERVHVLESIRAATADPASRIRVIATLRADFYDQPLSVRGFGDLLAARNEAITPMSPEELERAIVGPAERVGLDIESGLVAAMVADVIDRPGALPLLQYALTELADRKDVGSLTLNAYRRIGGVSGALARRAEHLYDALDDAGADACRQLFLRLVSLGEEDTRRRVRRSELTSADDHATGAVIDAFGRHRLLSFDRDPASREPTVEIAHEALLGAWARLRAWIDGARDDLRTRAAVATSAAEWQTSGRDESFLLRGGRLEQVAAWAETTSIGLSPTDEEYLAASLRRRDEERSSEQARLDRERSLERRSVKRLRALVAVLVAAALVAGTLTAIALDQSANARRASGLAAARELATAAAANLEKDRELAMLLALEAIRVSRDNDGTVLPEADAVLRRAAPAVAIDTTSVVGTSVTGVAMSSDGTAVAFAGEDGVAVWDLRTGSRSLAVRSTETCDGYECPHVFFVDLSEGGSILAGADGEGQVHVWNVGAAREILTVSNPYVTPPYFGPDVASWPALSPDGRFLATGELDDTVQMWDIPTRQRLWSLRDLAQPIALTFSPDASHLYFGPGAARTGHGPSIVDVESGRAEILLTDGTVAGGGTSFSADGSRVAFAHEGPNSVDLEVWDVSSKVQVSDTTTGFGPLALSPDGRVVATSDGPALHLLDADSLDRLRTIEGHSASITDIKFSPDGRTILTTSLDGTARVWEAESGDPIFVSPLRLTDLVAAAFSADASRITTVYEDGTILVQPLAVEDVIEIAEARLTRTLTDEECRTYLHLPACKR